MAIEESTGGGLAPEQPGRYTRRGFLKLAGAAGLAIGLGGGLADLLAACGGTTASGTPAGGSRIQLVYQDWSTQWFPLMAQTELAKFQAAHPDIDVFYTPDPDNAMEQMPLDMQAGNAADVFQGTCEFFPSWAEKGYVLDLRQYVQRDIDPSVISDWDPAQYHALFDAAGHEFGVPKYQGTLVLYYNKDIFDEYGVPYPTGSWTHDDYLAAMKQLTRDTNNDGLTDIWGSMIDINWDRLQVHVNAWGGHVVDPADRTRCVIDGPESLAALEWVRARMWDDKVMATFTDVNNIGTQLAFAQGKLAMVEDGSWGLKGILENAGFRVGVAPIPAGPARRATLSTTDGFGIYAGTRHPEAAWELVKFLVSEEYALAMAKANLLQPARLSLVARWEEFVKEQYPEESRELDLDAFAAPHREGYSVVQEIFPRGMAQATSLLREAFTEIFTLGHAGLDILGDVSREIGKAQTGPAQ